MLNFIRIGCVFIEDMTKTFWCDFFTVHSVDECMKLNSTDNAQASGK